MPSFNEWLEQHPEMKGKPNSELAKAYNAYKKDVSQANKLFLEQEELEEEIRNSSKKSK